MSSHVNFDEQEYDIEASGLTNQEAGGHKAAINNPKVPEESKEHSRRVLRGEEEAHESNGDKHTNQVLGGYKATLKNPNVGDEAKQNAERILKEHDAL